MPAHPDPTTLEWILSRCEPIPFSGCWIWSKAWDRHGYAAVTVKRDGVFRRTEGHLAAYIIKNGPVPDGMMLDHRCRVRACCNPDHLEPVTPKENYDRGLAELPRRAAAMRNARQACPRCGTAWSHATWAIGERRVCRVCKSQRRQESHTEPRFCAWCSKPFLTIPWEPAECCSRTCNNRCMAALKRS